MIASKNTLLALDAKTLAVKDSFTGAGGDATPAVFAWNGKDLIVAGGADGRVYLLDSGALHTPLASADFNHDNRSSVFHLDQTKVIDGKFVRVLSWYDNEWGFSNRMADTAVAMAKLI